MAARASARLIVEPWRSRHERAGTMRNKRRGALHRSRATADEARMPYLVGHGFDLHRLEKKEERPEARLILGGMELEHDRGCVAHSDGDVVLHCVCDALLGALGEPDIGELFPDNDPKWQGQDSSAFLSEAVRRVEAKGYAIGNVDVTLIAQKPKMAPHKPAIRANLAKLLGVPESRVNLKAKTHERVDSLGENRSIGCHTIALLIRPDLISSGSAA